MTTSAPSLSVRAAVALTAFCVLAYEISLTRIFSVLFRSPFVFLILSIAICGLGLGAALAGGALARERSAPGSLAGPALLLAVLLPLPVTLLLTVGQALVAEANAVAVALFTLLPYVAAGYLLARAFARHAADAGRLYFFDLAGASLAALTTALLLSRTGGISLLFLLGALAAAGGAALGWRSRVYRSAGVLLTCGLLILFVGQTQAEFLRLPPVTSADQTRAKPLFRELADPAAGAEILFTRWSAVARTDVVRNIGLRPLYIWTDGDVPTQMEPFDGDLESVREQYRRFPGYLAYALQPAPERVLCIGPGGGLDVLLALLGGAKAIEPVELNPAIREVTEKFKGFYGDLYARPEVEPGLIIDEGRSYLSRATRDYDLIYFALAKSATTQQGGAALVDSYLYTVEAFGQYLDHLTDGGLLVLLLQEPHLTERCIITAVEALLARGLGGSEIADRIAWCVVRPEASIGPYRQVLVIRNGPFDEAMERRLMAAADAMQLVPWLAPGQPLPAPYQVLLGPAPTAERLAASVAAQPQYFTRLRPNGPKEQLSVRPVTDDRPFYADLSPGLHPDLRRLLVWTLILGVFAFGFGAVRAARVTGSAVAGAGIAGYFSVLGMAFLMVEVALIQKLVLLLGYPTLSLSVILFSLLVGGALGGRAANRGIAEAAIQRLPGILLPLAAGLTIAGLAAAPLTAALLRQPLAVRVLATVLVTLPLGFLMGQPFPSGLRRLGDGAASLIPAAWAVNGLLSVTGSVLAAAFASQIGYRMVLWIGAGSYLLVWPLARAWSVGLSEPAPAADGAESIVPE